jgi:hypothetical protein
MKLMNKIGDYSPWRTAQEAATAKLKRKMPRWGRGISLKEASMKQ